MKIAVVGTGYVGLVAGGCLAENVNEVICVDRAAAKVRLLQRGRIPIYAPGLEEMARRNRSEKRLPFTPALAKAVGNAKTSSVAVGARPARTVPPTSSTCWASPATSPVR